MSNKVKLTIEFDNIKAMKHFASWLCGQGEQDYWQWMECREQEETGNITVLDFDYHNEDKTKAEEDPKRYGKFLADNTIRTTCGRQDK
jgi:hypothetical protein